MSQLLTDIRSGVRMLFKYPTRSLVSVLSLGIGLRRVTKIDPGFPNNPIAPTAPMPKRSGEAGRAGTG
jgi:hypothetical protein